MKHERLLSRLFWFAVLPLAAAVRVWAAAKVSTPNIDSATPGLMAMDILEGARPLMFYGQSYFGALEAYVIAVWIRIIGPCDLALSLGPITFTLAWLVTLRALVVRLAGPAVAFGAALLAAFPSWGLLYLSYTSLGGYPATWFFGTLTWLVALRLAQEDRPPPRCAGGLLLLGLSAGLALWTNLQSAPLLAMAGVSFAPWLLRHARDRALWPWLIGAALLFLLAASPNYFMAKVYTGQHTVGWEPVWKKILANAATTWSMAVPPILLGHGRDIAWVRVLLWILVGAAALFRLGLTAAGRGAGRTWTPWAVALIFLVLYLPHPMAEIGAYRYLAVPLPWVLFALFAWPLGHERPWARRTAAGLLGLWVALQAGVMGSASEKALSGPRTLRTREYWAGAVARAHAAGAKFVELSGNYIFGLDGQVLSWAATNQIAFLSCLDERRDALSQRAEALEQIPLLCENRNHREAMIETLRTLGVRYTLSDGFKVALFHDFVVPRHAARAFVPEKARLFSPGGVETPAEAALDRVFDYAVEDKAAKGSGLWLDLGRVMPLDRIVLWEPNPSQAHLPQAMRIEASTDGVAWEEALSFTRRYANAYTIGQRVYANGYWGQMELALDGRTARYLRLHCLEPRRKARDGVWRIGEVLVFERLPGEPPALPDIKTVADTAAGKGVKTLFANRWLSARLFGDPRFQVLPRYNNKHLPSLRTRVAAAGDGVLVPAEMAGETRAILEKAGAVFTESGPGGLSLFHLQTLPASPRLHWNDHRLLFLADTPEPRGH